MVRDVHHLYLDWQIVVGIQRYSFVDDRTVQLEGSYNMMHALFT